LKKIDESVTPATRKKDIKFPEIDLDFLSFFIGVIDGDGYIQCRKRLNGYIEFNLVITFQNRDLKTFEFIENKLNLGTIKRVSDSLSKFVVYNFELKYILTPLFLKNNLYFLTKNRIEQYNLLLYTIENNIKKWEFLPEIIPNYNPFNVDNSSELLSINYFKN